jgi:hypothetical protein
MSIAKRIAPAQPTFSDLRASFEQYRRDPPENDFPTFLETLLFDQANGKPATRPSRNAECGRDSARQHLSSTAKH